MSSISNKRGKITRGRKPHRKFVPVTVDLDEIVARIAANINDTVFQILLREWKDARKS